MWHQTVNPYHYSPHCLFFQQQMSLFGGSNNNSRSADYVPRHKQKETIMEPNKGWEMYTEASLKQSSRYCFSPPPKNELNLKLLINVKYALIWLSTHTFPCSYLEISRINSFRQTRKLWFTSNFWALQCKAMDVLILNCCYSICCCPLLHVCRVFHELWPHLRRLPPKIFPWCSTAAVQSLREKKAGMRAEGWRW